MRVWAWGALLTVAILVSGCAVAPVAAPKPPAVPSDSPAPPPAPVVEQPVAPTMSEEPAAPQVKWLVNGHWGPVYTDDQAGKERPVAVLTFDDGPSAEFTPRVLDALKAEGAKAIFFVNGHAAKHPELIKRIVAEGHLLANHTMTHENLTRLSREEQRSQIAGVNEILEQITGQKPYWFRAPFGAFDDDTLAVLDELGMQLLNWSHGSGDWMEVHDGYKDPGLLASDVLAEQPRNSNMTPLHPGSVILFHDTLRHTAEALPDILQGLKAKGYTFVLPEPSRR